MEAEPSCDATVAKGKAMFVLMIELGALWKGAIFCCPSEQLLRDG
jgi:hypothetical protein